MAYGLKDACNVLITSRGRDKKPFLFADYLNSCSLSLSADAVYARAKGINKITFEGAKSGTFTMETEIFELKFLALLLGGETTTEGAEISKRIVANVNEEGKVVIPTSVVEGSISVFALDRDKKTHLDEVVIDEVAYNEGEAEISFIEPPVAEQDLAVYYLVSIPKAKKIKVTDKSNAGSFTIEGTTSIRDEFGEDHLFNIKLYNAKMQTNTELTMSAESVATLTATFDLMVDENNNMLELVMLEDGAEVSVNAIGDAIIGSTFTVR
jgi:hypothetical protein